jgi:hypothetical protein
MACMLLQLAFQEDMCLLWGLSWQHASADCMCAVAFELFMFNIPQSARDIAELDCVGYVIGAGRQNLHC